MASPVEQFRAPAAGPHPRSRRRAQGRRARAGRARGTWWRPPAGGSTTPTTTTGRWRPGPARCPATSVPRGSISRAARALGDLTHVSRRSAAGPGRPARRCRFCWRVRIVATGTASALGVAEHDHLAAPVAARVQQQPTMSAAAPNACRGRGNCVGTAHLGAVERHGRVQRQVLGLERCDLPACCWASSSAGPG